MITSGGGGQKTINKRAIQLRQGIGMHLNHAQYQNQLDISTSEIVIIRLMTVGHVTDGGGMEKADYP